MILAAQERLFINMSSYVRKDGGKSAQVNLLSTADNCIEQYFLPIESASQYGFKDASFGDGFSVDISVITNKFGTRVSISDARPTVSFELAKNQKGGK